MERLIYRINYQLEPRQVHYNQYVLAESCDDAWIKFMKENEDGHIESCRAYKTNYVLFVTTELNDLDDYNLQDEDQVWSSHYECKLELIRMSNVQQSEYKEECSILIETCSFEAAYVQIKEILNKGVINFDNIANERLIFDYKQLIGLESKYPVPYYCIKGIMRLDN